MLVGFRKEYEGILKNRCDALVGSVKFEEDGNAAGSARVQMIRCIRAGTRKPKRKTERVSLFESLCGSVK